MDYRGEATPVYGQPDVVAPGVLRLVAPNPGRMTYHGTNSFLVDDVLIDPGPHDAAHAAALLAACHGRLTWILVTHSHADHVGGLHALARATGARVAGFALGDLHLKDGDVVAGFEAVHTPGHAGDHLCFAHHDVLFSGDHVMGWSSSTVTPPDGNMGDYLRSLDKVHARPERLFLPAHGPGVTEPRPFVAGLKAHRLRREQEISAALPGRLDHLVAALYATVDRALWPAAERTVSAHLAKLADEGSVTCEAGIWRHRP